MSSLLNLARLMNIQKINSPREVGVSIYAPVFVNTLKPIFLFFNSSTVVIKCLRFLLSRSSFHMTIGYYLVKEL